MPSQLPRNFSDEAQVYTGPVESRVRPSSQCRQTRWSMPATASLILPGAGMYSGYVELRCQNKFKTQTNKKHSLSSDIKDSSIKDQFWDGGD